MQAVLIRATVIALLLLIVGCSQIPERPTAPAADPDVARAAELQASGQHLAAADLYRQLASRSSSDMERSRYLLAAAEASREGGDWDGVRGSLQMLEATQLDPAAALQQRLLQAESLLQQRRALDAIALLDAEPAASLPRELRMRYFDDLAATYRQLGNLLETANALQRLDGLQTETATRLQTQTEILRSLTLLNDRVLEQLQTSVSGDTAGWMELARLVKQYGTDPAVLTPELQAWRQRFPQHPALPDLLQDYQQRLQSQLQDFSRIAVLLPQSGPFAKVATAIRDGMMVSRFEMPESKRPTLAFYDSSDPANVWPEYNRAVAEGAQLVIGPLQKDAVSQLLRAGELPIPVLALNQVDTGSVTPANMYQFSLSPEDEARQAAERAWLDGSRRPIVLAPKGEWGDRLTSAFESRWRELGAEVAGTGRYDDDGHDYSDAIEKVLHLDQSSERHQQMVRWLGMQLEFEPRRRDDIDAVFLAARPVQAQGMRPQLQFHHAADLPIYTTSHAWQGVLSASQAEDMRGVNLPDIPWMVSADLAAGESQETVSQYLPESAGGYARLYAMGMDALRLAPHLKRLQSTRFESLDGSTGNLYMDESNLIHRQLVWIILDVQPTVVGFVPRLDLQGNTTAPMVQQPPSPSPPG